MAITPFRGSFHIEYFPKTASTAFAFGDAVTILPSVSGPGTLAKVTSTSPLIYGTIQKAVASTDSDYAANTMVPVLVGDSDADWMATLTGTAALTDTGEFIDAADEVSLKVDANTYGVARIVQVLSTTSGIVKLVKKSGPAVTTA